ncbi:MAG: hypothetical protein HQK60_14690 [Deltaproteobacteria bacterium]|nr:hypothetical protein [Deltaproteobacteria bacterium]
MDKKTLVKHLHNIIDRFEKAGQPFNLVMLIPVDPGLNNKFSILWSAAWIDGMTRSEAIHVLVEAIAEEMRSDDSKFEKIARVSPLRSTDPFVTEIIEEYEVKKGSLRMPNSYINGLLVEGAIILQSTPPYLSNLIEPASSSYAQPVTS